MIAVILLAVILLIYWRTSEKRVIRIIGEALKKGNKNWSYLDTEIFQKEIVTIEEFNLLLDYLKVRIINPKLTIEEYEKTSTNGRHTK